MIDPLISIKDLDDNNQEPELDPPKFELKIDKKFDLNITEYDKSPEEEQIFSKKEKFQFQYKIPEIKLEEEKLISSKIGKILEIENGIIHSERIKREFKVPKNLINTSLLEIIFEPNLPTETILTEVGTQIDIYEFIKLCLNPTPNPKIYRQLGDGFIKNYGLTIIIDSSYSCLGGLSREHSIDTIRVLFSSLSFIDLPSLNIIISTSSSPIVLCSEKGTLDVLSNKSELWDSLFYFLSEEYKCENSNLISAIRAAYNITNARKQEHTDYLFVLTDGFFSQAKRKAIIQEINYCISKNLLVIGIGLGIYPLGIEKLFPYIVYSKEPIQVIDAIAACFSDTKNSNSNLEIIEQIFPEKIFMKNEIFQNFKTYEPKNDVIDFLRKIPIFLNSYSFYVGERDDRNDDGNLQTVQSLIKHAMYPENFLEGKKVTVMFYSTKMSPKENPYLSFNFIKSPQFLTIL